MRLITAAACSLLAIWTAQHALSAAPTGKVQVTQAAWQQVEPARSFTLAVERQVYTALDGGGRIVLALQTGRTGPALDTFSASWSISANGSVVVQGEATLSQGLAAIDFDLANWPKGRYDVAATLKQAGKNVEEKKDFFEIHEAAKPATSGRVPLILPRGVVSRSGVTALTFGVPFPKGALHDASQVRVVTTDGKPVPAQTIVRSRWGYGDQASIRWLGVDIQAPASDAYWPQRKGSPYFLEFGTQIKLPNVDNPIAAKQTDQGIRIDTGTIAFTVRKQGFNLIDDVTLNGKPALTSGKTFGPYLVDHEGATYRAANDTDVKLTIEEQGPMRVVVRAEGWYVKDGSDGSVTHFSLPTDRLCKFVTRIEAYRGKAEVRVVHTWVLTYDSYTVRLKDVGISLPTPNAKTARFGVEGGADVAHPVTPQGLYLIQHQPDAFAIEDGQGKTLNTGKRTDGNAYVTTADGKLLGISHRETWQRFPKEIEVLPGEVRMHIWPAHGRTRDDIDFYAPDRYHQLWFAHQGKELDLRFPWENLFSVMRYVDNPSTGIYKPGGTAMGGVHASAMGTAITSDMMVQFGEESRLEQARDAAAAFQHHAHVLPDTQWLADSGALGPIHPYDPERFPQFEKAAQTMLYGYRNIQNDTGQYGMFLFRTWHHSFYDGDGKWQPYRLYSAGHHYEPYMPWLYYARSGDPEMLDIGLANIRHLTDLAIIHYDDPKYPHKEFWSGQRRLVGSTKHTNGFVSWGGDHAVFGHLTCYNGILLAHYLTGDLRLREVVVDEWQKTILEDRANPEFGRASRIEGVGRDNNNSLGELIDVYQMTYDPRLLAYIEPAMRRFHTGMKRWGLPIQNVLGFSGNLTTRAQLLEDTTARRLNTGAPKHGVFEGHSHGGIFALAALLEPNQGFSTEAMILSDIAGVNDFAQKLYAQQARAGAMCSVPDHLLYFPVILKALSVDTSLQLGGRMVMQPFPISTGWTHFVAREDTDAPFQITLRGTVGNPNAAIQVINPKGELILQKSIEAASSPSFEIPSDGLTGEYVIFIAAADAKDRLFVPITTLAQEVIVTPYWAQHSGTRFFTRHPNTGDGKVALQPHKTPGTLFSGDLSETLARTTTGEVISAAMPSTGMWIDLAGRYISAVDRKPLILAISVDSYFTPAEASLKATPKPQAKP